MDKIGRLEIEAGWALAAFCDEVDGADVAVCACASDVCVAKVAESGVDPISVFRDCNLDAAALGGIAEG